MEICTECRKIQFEELPFEDEPAITHLPNLRALQSSAESCCLCKAIYLSASELSARIHYSRTGEGSEPGGQVVCSLTGDNMHVREMGYYGEDDDGSYGGSDTGYAGPVYRDPVEIFPAPGIRSWLFGNWWRNDKDSPRQLIGLDVRLGVGPNLEDAVGNKPATFQLRGSSFRIRTELDSPLANVIPGRLRAADPSSRLGIARIRDWLENCNAKHSCVKTETPLPTRVLDIAVEVGVDTKAIRLVEPQGQNGKYIAVSHFWGHSHRIKTTKATIEQFKSEITYSSLQKTFKHAVVYARELNIRNLWIDTLCTIQDDPLDWEREASKMGRFYKDAYLTIAASSSSDDSTGLFQDMDTRMYDVSYVSSDALCHGRPGLWNTIPDTHIKKNGTHPMFAFNPDNGSAFVVYQTEAGVAKLFLNPEWMPSSTKANPLTYCIGEFGRSYDPLDKEPLSERGWILQEQLLSPRTIHFGSDQMYWECQECLLAEDGAIFSPNCRTVPTIRAVGLWDAIPEVQELSMADKADRKEYACSDDDNDSSLSSCDWSWSWKSTWTRIIENYSTRLLTMENDKLPALAGLARSMAERTGDFYQAGLWKSMLPDLLFWKVAMSEPTHMCKDPGHDKLLPPPWKSEVVVPPAYRAPS